MKRTVLSPGGVDITNANGGATVTTRISISGARILNMLARTHPEYRQQFLAFDRGGRKDAELIERESNELALKYILEEVAKARKRKLRTH